ncbi:MAG: hypothetical protein V3R85_06440 [Alphaproteobacteria bacterium]
MHIPHGHSVHPQQIERAGGPPSSVSTNSQKPEVNSGGFNTDDQVDLSPAAKSFIATGGSMNSPAHQVRAMLTVNGDSAGMSFGQAVSGFNHGTLILTPPSTGGEGIGDSTTDSAVVTDPTTDPVVAGDDTSDPVVAGDDTTDPVVAGDDTTDPVVAADDTSDPVIVADDTTDPVVAADDTSDPVIVADETSDPVVVADPIIGPVIVGETTSDLLDILEGDEDPATSDQVV